MKSLIYYLENAVQALKYPSADAVTPYMSGFKAINWKLKWFNKIDKPKWPPQPCFQSHMKTDNTNKTRRPRKPIFTRFRGKSEKK